MDLLKRHGFKVDDHHIGSQKANEAYKEESGYDETPQVWIEGEHVGGYDALRKHFGLDPVRRTRKSGQGRAKLSYGWQVRERVG